jgi:hypothetical protein
MSLNEKFYLKWVFFRNDYVFKEKVIASIRWPIFPFKKTKFLFEDNTYFFKRISNYHWGQSEISNDSDKIIAKWDSKPKSEWSYLDKSGTINLGTAVLDEKEYLVKVNLLWDVSIIKKGTKEGCLSFNIYSSEGNFDSKKITIQEAVFVRLMVQRLFNSA